MGATADPVADAAIEDENFTEPRMIPGRILHRLAAAVCSAKTLERVVEPAIADLQKEHAQALDVRRRTLSAH